MHPGVSATKTRINSATYRAEAERTMAEMIRIEEAIANTAEIGDRLTAEIADIESRVETKLSRLEERVRRLTSARAG